MGYGDRKPKGDFTPIYRDEVQYQLNNLIFEYHDKRKLLSLGEVTIDEWKSFKKDVFHARKVLTENEEPVERILDYSMEMRTKDQEYLEVLLGLDTDDYIGELNMLLEEIEDEMV